MKRFWGATVTIVIGIVVIIGFMSYEANNNHKTDAANEANFVYDRFHLRLPRDSAPLLDKEEQGNFHGDGYRLLIFQLSPAGQENLMEQSYFASWSQLPVGSALQDKLESLLQVSELTEWVDLEGEQGFYIVLSQNYGYVINAQNAIGQKNQERHDALRMDDDLWRNISLAILDTQKYQLIIYTWDA